MLVRRQYRRKRPAYRRRTRRTRYVRRKIPRPIAVGVPKFRYAKLSYCDVLSSSVSASGYQTWPYQSSCYDPYQPAGGHQPMFYDQFSVQYTRWTVMGIAYNVDITCDNANAAPLIFCVVPTNAGVTPTSVSIARERTGTKETMASSIMKGKLKGYISVAKMLGVDRRKLLTDDQYSGAIAANPAQMAYLTFAAYNLNTVAVTPFISMRLTFYVRFFDPAEPGQS